MLVLTRKVEESIVLGGNEDQWIKVLKIEGNRVRLGFNLPPEVKIHRREVFVAIQKKKELKNDSVEV